MSGGSAALQSLHMARGETFCLAGDTTLGSISCSLPHDELLVGKRTPAVPTHGQLSNSSKR